MSFRSENPPAGSLEDPVTNCKSFDRSSWLRLSTNLQKYFSMLGASVAFSTTAWAIQSFTDISGFPERNVYKKIAMIL